MKLVGREVLERFCEAQPDCRRWISAWITDVRGSTWRSPQDIKDKYVSVSFLADSVVIFNVRGNNYRLVVRVAYGVRVVFVQWIGTHAEYDKKRF
jgi:mRNA interferase HigB